VYLLSTSVANLFSTLISVDGLLYAGLNTPRRSRPADHLEVIPATPRQLAADHNPSPLPALDQASALSGHGKERHEAEPSPIPAARAAQAGQAARGHRRGRRADRTRRPPAAAAQAAGLPALTCSAHTLAVRIADPGPADHDLRGQLCYRGSHEPATVQLLVHGATYNHLYWNFPYGNGYYSYVDAATAAGYATFDTDRIGDGTSSHPPSSELTLDAGAVPLHDAVTALRKGAVDGHAFQHLIMVGHSVGSVEAWIEIARYHDVDAVIITGALHAMTPGIGALESDLCPAADAPAFGGFGLDPGCLTTLPGTRGSLFRDLATFQPGRGSSRRSEQGHNHPG
jgi:hypothetical protein